MAITGFYTNAAGLPQIDKAAGTGADATLDYSQNWSGWLAAVSDTLSGATVVCPGLTVGAPAIVDGTVGAIFSGGTVGQAYPATWHISTVGGRSDSRTIVLNCVAR